MNEKRSFQKVGIAGVGLIGASFALALREHRMADEIWGYSASGKSTDIALDKGIIDKKAESPEEMARQCDLIFIAVPVMKILPLLKKIAPHVRENAIVTDGGSVKNFVQEAHNLFQHRNFVGGHPIAGTERSGPEAGFAGLFSGSCCIITPVDGSHAAKLDTVCKIWQQFGMNVVEMQPEEHDKAMADISHMPHAVAFCLGDSVREKAYGGRKVVSLAGGGFRDFTRIARSDPDMWADIFISNKKELLASLDDFEKSLKLIRSHIENGDREKIQGFLNRTRLALLANTKK